MEKQGLGYRNIIIHWPITFYYTFAVLNILIQKFDIKTWAVIKEKPVTNKQTEKLLNLISCYKWPLKPSNQLVSVEETIRVKGIPCPLGCWVPGQSKEQILLLLS